MKKHLLFAVLAAAVIASADVIVPAIFSDFAVLQKSPSTAVFGKADPGEKVTVSYGDAKGTAVAGNDGKWIVRLDLSKADDNGKELIISGRNKLVFKDVIVGEVWFCIGQSNMAMAVYRTLNAKEYIAKSANDKIRNFGVNLSSSEKPVDIIRGRWRKASPESTGNFSATGYFFARKINAETGRAVGMINSSWGGSCIEAWMCHNRIMNGSTPEVAKYAQKKLDTYYGFDARSAEYVKKLNKWCKDANRVDDQTSPIPADSEKWVKAGKLTGSFNGDGVIWFKQEFNITPKDIRYGKLSFEFGRPVVPVKVYFDGTLIGTLDLKTAVDGKQFSVDVPKELVTFGKHTVALRVSAITPRFSFPRTHRAGRKDSTNNWMMCRERDFAKLNAKEKAAMPKYIGNRPVGYKSPNMVWNGMVYPIIPYTMKGAIWYQGEENADGQRFLYRDQFKALVEDMREHFENPELRFYAVQLPNYMDKKSDPNITGNWVDIRAGLSSRMNMPYVAQAIIIDLGESGDGHPIEKRPVGERLAAIALHNDYGKKDMPCYSPEAVEAVKEGNALRVNFKHTDGGLVARKLPDFYWVIRNQNKKASLVRNSPNAQVEGFALCGKDGKWFWADKATLDGTDVVVSSANVTDPVAIRYAWQNNPTCNLYNGAGFPAAPFELKVK